MTSIRHKQAVWGQSHDQTRRRPVSPRDVTYVLGSMLLAGMRVIPAPRRVRVISKASSFLAKLAYAANVHPTPTLRGNMNKLWPGGWKHPAVADNRGSALV